MGALEPRKDWKAVQFDYDFVRDQSEDTCLFCLSKRQVSALLTLMPLLRWKTRWYSPTDTAIDDDWLAAFVANLELELMSDHCDLQSQLDTIINNITTINNNITEINTNIQVVNNNLTEIDASLTVINQDINNITIQYITTINNTCVITNYINFTTVVGDTDTESFARYLALCNALIRWLMDTGYRAFKAYLDSGQGYLQDIYDQLLAWGGEIVGNPIVDPVGLLEYEVYTALMSTSDVEAVACHMLTVLAPLAIDYTNFQAALATFSPANTNQTIIANLASTGLALLNAYYSFVSILAAEYQKALATAPTDYTTPCCDTPDFFSTVDFKLGQKIPWLITIGQLELGDGIRSLHVWDASNSFFWNRVSIHLDFPSPVHITSYALDYLCTTDKEGLTQSANTQIFFETYSLSGGVYTLISSGAVSMTADNAVHTINSSGGLDVANVSRFVIRSGNVAYRHYYRLVSVGGYT